MNELHLLDILAARHGCFISDLNLSPILLSGELNDALSGRLFYADFRFPQGYQSL